MSTTKMSNYPQHKLITPNWFKLLIIKLFGTRYTLEDEEGTVIFYDFRKTYYVTKVIQKDEHETYNT